jgi:hypothetical protein
MATPAACVVECWLEIKLQATNQSKILIAPSALLFLSQPEQPGARIMDLAVLGSLLIASQDPLSACSTAVRRFSRRAFSRIQMSLESMRGTKLIIPDSGHRPGGDHIETLRFELVRVAFPSSPPPLGPSEPESRVCKKKSSSVGVFLASLVLVPLLSQRYIQPC